MKCFCSVCYNSCVLFAILITVAIRAVNERNTPTFCKSFYGWHSVFYPCCKNQSLCCEFVFCICCYFKTICRFRSKGCEPFVKFHGFIFLDLLFGKDRNFFWGLAVLC